MGSMPAAAATPECHLKPGDQPACVEAAAAEQEYFRLCFIQRTCHEILIKTAQEWRKRLHLYHKEQCCSHTDLRLCLEG